MVCYGVISDWSSDRGKWREIRMTFKRSRCRREHAAPAYSAEIVVNGVQPGAEQVTVQKKTAAGSSRAGSCCGVPWGAVGCSLCCSLKAAPWEKSQHGAPGWGTALVPSLLPAHELSHGKVKCNIASRGWACFWDLPQKTCLPLNVHIYICVFSQCPSLFHTAKSSLTNATSCLLAWCLCWQKSLKHYQPVAICMEQEKMPNGNEIKGEK